MRALIVFTNGQGMHDLINFLDTSIILSGTMT